MTPHSNHNIEIEPPKPMPPARRGRRVWIVLVGLVALAIVLVPMLRGKRSDAGADKRAAAAGGKGMLAERKPSVRVMTLQPQPFAVVLEGLGTVTPLATVTVKTQVDGPLLSVAYQEG